jgi:hypothetical protein
MGRPRKARKQAVSLFPFLDILACVIGNLILIIAAVVLEQVDTKPVAEAARIDDLEDEAMREETKAAALQKQLDDLRERAGMATEKLEEVRVKIAAAKKRLTEAEARAREATKPVERQPDATADLKKLDESRKAIEADIKDLERQIAERKRPPEQIIAILPPGEGSGPRKGIFVEAAKDGLVIHDGKAPWKVPTGKVPSDPQLKTLLEKVKQDPHVLVTFLVRADGLASLAAGQKLATAVGVRSGRVPLPGDGKLDLTGAR